MPHTTAGPTANAFGLAIDVLLRDGHVASIRPVLPSDEADLRALNERVSLRTRMRRYFSVSDRPGDWYVTQLMQQSHNHSALVAVVGGQLVALGSFARVERDPDVGDLAVLVDDEHQSAGLGALLLEHLAQLAQRQGVHSFVADVLLDNGPMLRLLRDSGFSTRTTDTADGVTQLAIDLADNDQLRAAVHRREAAAESASLKHVLAPRSVAVVGSARPTSVGGQVLASLGDFTGVVHHIGEAGRLAALTDVDLVVVAVPAAKVLEVAREAATAGAKGLLVLSADFAESGPQGRARQSELLEVCRAASMRLVGPNCLGIVNTDPEVRLNATFCDAHPRPGAIALVSQSGAIGIAALRHAERRGAGLSLFVSTGNKADVSGNDLLDHLESDPRTSAIALYLESFGNPRKFARVAATVGRTKPVVVVKSGTSEAGARAGLSHTAAATTPEVAIEALLHEAGVIRAADLPEMFDVLSVLEVAPLPRGSRVAVIGNSGGPGVLAADACARSGLTVAELSAETRTTLSALVPGGAVANPVDLLATVSEDAFLTGLGAVLGDPGVDAVIAIYTPLLRGAEEHFAEALMHAHRRHPDTPVIAAFPGVSFPPAALSDAHGAQLVPFFEFPEPAAYALGHVARYAAWKAQAGEATWQPRPVQRRRAAQDLLERSLGNDPNDQWLSPSAATALLGLYGIPTARLIEAADPDSAVKAADELGYPVAVKAAGPTIVHKSDVGGVVLDLDSPEQVRMACADLQERLGEALTGVVVQRMHRSHGGLELIAGVTVDPSIGPLVMVGAGGVDTDLLGDRSVRMPAHDLATATDQLNGLRCARRFAGYRGRDPLDLEATAQVLVALGALAEDLPGVRELDINPLVVSPEGITGLDVRIRAGATTAWQDLNTRSLRPVPELRA